MKNLKCPKCGYELQLDDADLESIVAQIRNQEFEQELAQRLNELTKQMAAAEVNRQLQTQQKHADALHAKETEIATLKAKIETIAAKLESEKTMALAHKDNEIARLKEKVDSAESNKKIEVANALTEAREQMALLQAELARKESDAKVKLLENQSEFERRVSEKETALERLQARMELSASEAARREGAIKEDYERRLKEKDEQIGYYKDLKARLSTKMLGETLEQHCLNVFNSHRALMFPEAYFDKDNDTRPGGTKGDFIFRDFIEGQEYISIMFEMKNEGDTPGSKQTNEHFLDKLNKDRNEKKCEYAVLVSLLEPESELYNQGIVDVSYRHPKMYVIRPQFFLAVISMLSQAGRGTVALRRQLTEARQTTIDVSGFEQKWLTFQASFGYNVEQARKRYEDALNSIDSAIKTLTKIRELFTKSDNNLRLANQKAQDLTIKKLTHNNPTMKELFRKERQEHPIDYEAIEAIRRLPSDEEEPEE